MKQNGPYIYGGCGAAAILIVAAISVVVVKKTRNYRDTKKRGPIRGNHYILHVLIN